VILFAILSFGLFLIVLLDICRVLQTVLNFGTKMKEKFVIKHQNIAFFISRLIEEEVLNKLKFTKPKKEK
jgi:uncharacterized membrane protein